VVLGVSVSWAWTSSAPEAGLRVAFALSSRPSAVLYTWSEGTSVLFPAGVRLKLICWLALPSVVRL
jgi:hypothetical protein